MAKSTNSRRLGKPAKPYPDFPLFPHATRRWAKKIRGQLHYFGPWDDPYGALNRFLEHKDDLYAGRPVQLRNDGVTVRHVVNRFLTSKQHLMETGELAKRTFDSYYATGKTLVAAFGRNVLAEHLGPDDFERLRRDLAKTRGPVALGNEIQRIRTVFKYAYDMELLDKPLRFGPQFKRPSRRTLRRARMEKGPRMFEAAQIRTMIAAASEQLSAMILLGINCGYGNADCATLPVTALDLDGGWTNYPRPKTGVPRRAPLWPETVAALRSVIEHRPTPKDDRHSGLVFITKYGKSWFKDSPENPISRAMHRLLDKLDLYRPGLTFYALRHTFETIAGDSKDQVAVNFIMGHVDNSMSAVYRERISDDRLVSVSDVVHAWLFDSD